MGYGTALFSLYNKKPAKIIFAGSHFSAPYHSISEFFFQKIDNIGCHLLRVPHDFTVTVTGKRTF